MLLRKTVLIAFFLGIASFALAQPVVPTGMPGNSELPIGTIISSVLDPNQFANQVGDPPVFEMEKSKWTLADGKDLSKTKYATLSTNNNKAPDLRGVFLRGINCGKTGENCDPDGERNPGSFQPDALQKHIHKITRGADINPNQYRALGSTGGGNEIPTNAPLDARTADETRPKNIAVYFYIKVN